MVDEGKYVIEKMPEGWPKYQQGSIEGRTMVNVPTSCQLIYDDAVNSFGKAGDRELARMKELGIELPLQE